MLASHDGPERAHTWTQNETDFCRARAAAALVYLSGDQGQAVSESVYESVYESVAALDADTVLELIDQAV